MSSSTRAQYEQQLPSSQLLRSSPPAAFVSGGSSRPRKPPPITPKRFNKFFTPRSTRNRGISSLSSRAGRQLRDITQGAVNSRNNPRERGAKAISFADITPADGSFQTPKLRACKKRKDLPTPDSSPLQSSPSKRLRSYSPEQHNVFSVIEEEEDDNLDPQATCDEHEPVFQSPIRRLRLGGVNSRLLQRSFGQYCHRREDDHCAGT